MIKVRISYKSEEEKDKLLISLSKSHKILSISKAYKNRNNDNKRVYVDLEVN